MNQTKVELHCYWQAIGEWCQEKRYHGQVIIILEAGIPAKFCIQDGIVLRSILVKDVMKELNNNKKYSTTHCV